MHKVFKSLAVGFLFSSVAAVSLAGQPASPRLSSADIASLETATFQQDLANLAAPIRSERSMQRHLNGGLEESPLRYLSKPALGRFISSLQFNENGLTTYRYADLEAELTPSQIYQVLALFGQQHNTPMLRGAKIRTELDTEIMRGPIPGIQAAIGGDQCDIYSPIQSPTCGDKQNYRCIERGTCAENSMTICTKNC